MNAAPPVVVFTSSDRVTAALLQALPHVPLAFAETEPALQRRVSDGASLVVLHYGCGACDAHVAGRLVRAVPRLGCPVVALVDRTALRDDTLFASDFHDDVICLRREPWHVLLAAWATQPKRAAELVGKLRLLHGCAPAGLLPVFDRLLFVPEELLSVKSWSGVRGVSRSRLYRELRGSGRTPSDIVDVVRTVHLLGMYMDPSQAASSGRRPWSAVRLEQRVLVRTLGLTRAEILVVAERGAHMVRELAMERLRDFLCRALPQGHATTGRTSGSERRRVRKPQASGQRDNNEGTQNA